MRAARLSASAAPDEAGAPRHVLMTADAVGGVLSYAVDLATGLASRGVRTTLAVLGPSLSEAQRRDLAGMTGVQLVETGLPLDWLAADADEVLVAASELASLAGQVDAELVHLNAPSLACAAYGRPVVSVLHSCVASWWAKLRGGALPQAFRWQARLTAWGLARSDAVLCPSAAFADTAERIYGLRPVAIHNGRAAPAISGCGVPAPFVFTAGRLWDEGKDVATLDSAARRIALPVLAAGPTEGPNGARIAPQAVGCLGTVDAARMRSLLSKRPIFVSTALYEPFGLAVLEAAQAGCALVLSDIPTFRELWGGAAVFVPERDAGALAAVLAGLGKDEARRSALGSAARARAARYGIEAMAGATLAVYSALHARSRLQCGGAAA